MIKSATVPNAGSLVDEKIAKGIIQNGCRIERTSNVCDANLSSVEAFYPQPRIIGAWLLDADAMLMRIRMCK